jgi:hypothetical protein
VDAGLDRAADGVEVLDQAEVEGDRVGAGGPEEVHRHARRAAVQHDPVRQGGDHGGEFLLDHVVLDGGELAEAADGRQSALQDGGQGRLVELDDQMSSRDARGDLGCMSGEALGQGLREVPAGAGVDDRTVAAAALEARGQGPGPGRLHLERAGVVAGDIGERIEVAGEELPGPALVDPRARDQPPARRGEVHREVDQQGRAAADQVRAGPSAGQLGQVREVRQLAEHEAQRLGRVGAGQ